jgi:hypothetical protein
VDGSGDSQDATFTAVASGPDTAKVFTFTLGVPAGSTGATGPAGTGDVIKVGEPVDSQVGVWTGDGTIEGTSSLVFDGTNLGIGTDSIDKSSSGKSTIVTLGGDTSSGATIELVGDHGADNSLGEIRFINDRSTNADKTGAMITGRRAGANNNTGELRFYTTSASSAEQRMVITSGGNVKIEEKLGVGRTAASATLEVQGTSLFVDGTATFQHTSSNLQVDFTANNSTILNFTNGTSEGTVLRTDEYFRFDTGGATERLRITSGGDCQWYNTSAAVKMTWDASAASLGIGTDSPTGAKLDIRTDSTTIIDAGATLNVEEDTTWTQGIAFYVNNADAYNADYASACIGVVNSGSGITISSGARVVDNPSNSNGYKTLSGTTAAVYRQKDGAHIFYSNTGIAAANTLFTPTERMRITEGGDCQWYDTSAAVKMTWDASAESLGIGTEAPASGKKLHVVGNVLVEGASAASRYISITSADGATGWTFGNGVTAAAHQFEVYDNTAGATRLQITSAGLVGIGVAVPAKKLEVSDSSSGESIPIVLSNRDVTAGTGQKVTLGFGLARNSGAFKPEAGTIEVGREKDWTSADNYIDSYMAFSVYENNAAIERLRITSAGNVDIGGSWSLNANGTGTWGETGNYGGFTWDTGKAVIYAQGSNSLVLKPQSADGITITSGGDCQWYNTSSAVKMTWDASESRLGIGTTAPNENLHIAQADSGDSYVQFTNSSTSHGGSRGFHVGLNSSEQASLWQYESGSMVFGVSNDTKMTITSAGLVGVGLSPSTEVLETAGNISFYNTSGANPNTLKSQGATDASISGHFHTTFGCWVRNENTTRAAGMDGTTSGSELMLYSNSVERLRITSAGRVTVKKSSNSEIATLTSASTITPDMDDADNFSLTLDHDTTLANPDNLTAGQSGCIVITQGSTGGTMLYEDQWHFEGGTEPELSAAGAVDNLVYYVASTDSIHAVLLKDLY